MTQTPDKGIEIVKDGDKVNIVLDMSMFDLFEMCEARYNYRHNHNFSIPITQKSDALDSGALLHEGMEVYFNALMGEVKYQDRINLGLHRMRAVGSNPDQCNLDPDEVGLVMRAFEESCEYWRFEDEQLDIIEIERAFAYVLYEDDEIRIILTGKIDLLVNIPPIGGQSGYKKVPIDHKSFKRDFEVPRLSNQFINYCNAVGSKYLIVNRIGLHDPEAKKPKPAGEKFKRITLSYDDAIIADWRRNVTRIILGRYLHCIASGEWNMNFTSCFKFNRKCEYYEICETSGTENKLIKLNQGFDIVSPWDVTATFKKN